MLDAESLQAFKQICKVNYGVELSEIEAQQAADRVIRFLIASGEQRRPPSLSDREASALVFIKQSIDGGRTPSVREIASHLNLVSSRSAHKVVQNLVAKGIVARDREGRLILCSRDN